MRVLVLGGTVFLGRHLAHVALARGHEVTLFHRGRSDPAALPAASHVIGDRDGGLGALAAGRWDAVFDTSGYVPRLVRDAARFLEPRAEHYTFVSSVSVYADPIPPGADERQPVGRLADEGAEEVTGASYGPLKALCEREALAAFGARAAIVRPGLIVGPHDPTDRFTWWLRRLARGGETLAPGRPDAPVQFVDARDLATWMLRLAEARAGGTWHATGPATPLTMGECLARCGAAIGSSARLTWVDEEFLLARGVRPWTELPLWVPAADEGFARLDLARALADGLELRPIEDTARATLRWDTETPREGRPKKAGLSFEVGMAPEREAALLAEHAARGSSPASRP